MQSILDDFAIGFLLIPQIAVVALVPYFTYRFANKNTSESTRVRMVPIVILGFIAITFCRLLAELTEGWIIRPGPLGVHLIDMQVDMLLVLLVLGILAGVLTLRKIGTLGLWEFVIMAGLVPFWFMVGLAPGKLNWPVVTLAVVVGATAGITGSAFSGGHNHRDMLKAGALWAAAGAAGVIMGLATAMLAGTQTPYTGISGPPSLSDQTSVLVSVAVAVGLWLGLYTLASATLTEVRPTQFALLAKGLLAELLLLAVYLAASFMLERIYPGEFAAHLTPPASYAVLRYPASGMAIADVDADGHADLIVTNDQFSTKEVLFGNGDGTFRPPENCQTHCVAVGSCYRMEATGDFDGDGREDKASAAAPYPAALKNGTISVQLNTEGGTLREAGTYGVGRDPQCVVVADLNSDNRADLVVANAYSNDLTFLLGNGDGTFRPGGNALVGEYPHCLGVGDLNGDGKPDLVVSASGWSNIVVLLSR